MPHQSPINSRETLRPSGGMQRFARPKVVLEGIGIKIVYCKSSEWKSETISRPQSRDTGLEFPTYLLVSQNMCNVTFSPHNSVQKLHQIAVLVALLRFILCAYHWACIWRLGLSVATYGTYPTWRLVWERKLEAEVMTCLEASRFLYGTQMLKKGCKCLSQSSESNRHVNNYAV